MSLALLSHWEAKNQKSFCKGWLWRWCWSLGLKWCQSQEHQTWDAAHPVPVGVKAQASCQPTLGSEQWPGEVLCRRAQKPELTAACSRWDYSAALKMKEQMVLMGERGPEVQDGIVTMLITRQQIPQCFLLAWKMRIPWRPPCDPQRSGSTGQRRLQAPHLFCCFWDVALICLRLGSLTPPSLPVPWEAFEDVKCWNTKLGWFWIKAERLLWNLGPWKWAGCLLV